jgi:hypothetical protein
MEFKVVRVWVDEDRNLHSSPPGEESKLVTVIVPMGEDPEGVEVHAILESDGSLTILRTDWDVGALQSALIEMQRLLIEEEAPDTRRDQWAHLLDGE